MGFFGKKADPAALRVQQNAVIANDMFLNTPAYLQDTIAYFIYEDANKFLKGTATTADILKMLSKFSRGVQMQLVAKMYIRHKIESCTPGYSLFDVDNPFACEKELLDEKIIKAAADIFLKTGSWLQWPGNDNPVNFTSKVNRALELKQKNEAAA